MNYDSAWLPGIVLPQRAFRALFDWVIASLHRRLDAETEDDLARSMRFPARWDPFFRETMILADAYHFHHANSRSPDRDDKDHVGAGTPWGNRRKADEKGRY